MRVANSHVLNSQYGLRGYYMWLACNLRVLCYADVHVLTCNPLDDEALKIQIYLNQAKRDGLIVQLKHLTVLLVGTSGVGKTSFLKVLQGEDPPEGHKPTNAQ